MKAISVLIACVFSGRVIDCLVNIAPGFQTPIDVVFIGKNQAPNLNGLLENGRYGFLLDIGKHVEDHLPAPLDHAQDRRFFRCSCSTPTLAFQPSAASFTAQLRHDFRVAFMPCDDVDLIGFDLTA
jgi:hypothetical protein